MINHCLTCEGPQREQCLQIFTDFRNESAGLVPELAERVSDKNQPGPEDLAEAAQQGAVRKLMYGSRLEYIGCSMTQEAMDSSFFSEGLNGLKLGLASHLESLDDEREEALDELSTTLRNAVDDLEDWKRNSGQRVIARFCETRGWDVNNLTPEQQETIDRLTELYDPNL